MIKNYGGLLTCEDYKCDSQSAKPKKLTAIPIQLQYRNSFETKND